ncbi:hypothetical protein KKI23_00970 [Patescibacteria group bacterium]|nr:hypothetical protein [Patescibacteria group bacterium]
MKKLLIGTNNTGKFDELKDLLSQYGFTCFGLKEVGIHYDVEEVGRDYQENALLKAKTYAHMSGILTVSGDSGLSIDALNGEPGICSRNLTGEKRNTDQELTDYIVDKMKNITEGKRQAKLVAAIAICNPKGKCNVEEAFTEGVITEKVDTKKIPGYPYRSLFKITSLNKMYCQLSDEELKTIAHRAEAVKKLSKYFKQYD